MVGQEKPKEKLASKFLMYKHGLNKEDKPAGVLLFPGPSGVGKTSMVKVFSNFLFGSPKTFTRGVDSKRGAICVVAVDRHTCADRLLVVWRRDAPDGGGALAREGRGFLAA